MYKGESECKEREKKKEKNNEKDRRLREKERETIKLRGTNAYTTLFLRTFCFFFVRERVARGFEETVTRVGCNLHVSVKLAQVSYFWNVRNVHDNSQPVF